MRLVTFFYEEIHGLVEAALAGVHLNATMKRAYPRSGPATARDRILGFRVALIHHHLLRSNAASLGVRGAPISFRTREGFAAPQELHVVAGVGLVKAVLKIVPRLNAP